jgi:glycosyltransferase involved in cell wall biosynthesis
MSEPAILQVIPELSAGGAERTTVDIARALTGHGFRALVASEGGRMEHELAAAGAELIRMPVASKSPLRIWRNAGALARIIRERNVVLIHARSRAPAWSALLAARRTGIPFVTTYHGVYNARLRLKRWYNSIMARGDAVIANSQWTARHILAVHHFQPKNLKVIPRGIDLHTFSAARVGPERVQAIRDWWMATAGDRVVLLPGRLSRWKGQIVFVRAFGQLKREGRLPEGVRAVIAGDAQGRESYVQEILATIATEGVGDTVVLATHVGDMPAAYRAADIVVSASTDPEAFGRVPPEAAAMGRPVIATDHGGARETVLSGESGLLVKPNSATALADALAQLLAKTPGQLAAMGAKGRAYIEEAYTVERMCADTLALYESLVAKKGRPATPA